MRVCVAIMLLGLTWGTAAAAVGAEDAVYEFDPEIPDGSKVRLRTVGGNRDWVEGHALSLDGRSLRLLVEADTLSVSLAGIETLSLSRGTGGNAGKGALIGGTVVAVFSLGLGVAVATDDSFNGEPGAVFGVTVIGFGAGALLGAVVGAFIRTEKWEDVNGVRIGAITTPDHGQGLAVAWRF